METAEIGVRLRQARGWAGFSQQDAADALGIPRELISYWENGRRLPGYAQVRRLATLYGTSASYLIGEASSSKQSDEHALIYRDLPTQAPRTRAATRQWLAFLEDWADLREEAGDRLPGQWSPPEQAWRQPRPITDSRRAPGLADDVRRHYRLGADAIPDLVAFLDAWGILVYRIPLDPLDQGGISGAFYNHPRLGACILVNTTTTPGRQTFTLAHEFAHALFHYQETGLVSRAHVRDRRERFADVFASHFLVPSGTLFDLIEHVGDVGPLEILQLQRYFRVSYAMLLYRLLSEGILSQEEYDEYRGYSPSYLASILGLSAADYLIKQSEPEVGIESYSVSVLSRVRAFVEADELSPPAAASLLDISQEELATRLLAPPQPATGSEVDEFSELPEEHLLTSGRRRKG